MDHTDNNSTFIDIPRELTTKIVINALSYAQDIDEALRFVDACKRVDQQLTLNETVENEQHAHYLIKLLHKKFEISKLQVRYMLPTALAQKQLLEKMEIISKYAFLNYPELLTNPLSRTRVYTRTALPLLALERAHKTLQQKRKNDPQFWKNNHQEIPNNLQIKKADSIDAPVCNDSDLKINELKNLVAFLAYLVEHCNEVIISINTPLQDKLKEQKNLFSLLIAHIEHVFYPTPTTTSPIYKEFCNRIKTT